MFLLLCIICAVANVPWLIQLTRSEKSVSESVGTGDLDATLAEVRFRLRRLSFSLYSPSVSCFLLFSLLSLGARVYLSLSLSLGRE